MNYFRLGMIMAKISASLEEDELKKVQPYINELQDELLEPWNTEEKPDKNGDYIILWKTDDSKRLYYEIQEFYDGEWIIDIPQAGKREIKVLAWLELPPIPEGVKV